MLDMRMYYLLKEEGGTNDDEGRAGREFDSLSEA